MKCDMNCFNCKFEDCICGDDNDLCTLEEYHLSQSLDKDIVRDTLPKEVLKTRKQKLDWYHRNRKTELVRQAEYREANRERLREEARQYHAEHREEDNQRHLANYYANHEYNKKKARESKRARWRSNPEYYRQKQREYRQRVKERSKQNVASSS